MRALFPVLLTLFLVPSTSSAEVLWKNSMHPYLEGRSDESESDRIFSADCRYSSVIVLRVGADVGVRKGKGERVTLRFASDGRAAAIEGVSRRSADYEMTGGTELVASVPPENPVFQVLLTGKPIKITGSISKPATLDGNALKTSLEKFLADCKATE